MHIRTSSTIPSIAVAVKLALGLVLSTLIGCQSTAPTQEPKEEAAKVEEPKQSPEPTSGSSHPTYLSPDLNIFSYLKDPNSDMSLTEQLIAPWSLMIPVLSKDGSQQFVVSSCLQALSAAQQGISPDNPVAFPQFRFGVVQCMAIQLAQEMQPASQSYFGAKVVEQDFLNQMPASSAFVVTEQDAFKARTAKSSAADISPVNRFQPYGDYRATFDLGFGSQSITVLARGDVNHDGIDDALLQVVNTEYSGSYRLTFLFIVTKQDKNAPIQLIGGY